MKNRIIGLSSKLGAGKDTVAELIARQTCKDCEKHAFADTLREMVQIITQYKMGLVYQSNDNPFTNIVYNYTQADKNVFLPEWGMTLGEILQKIGTECLRNNFDQDVWVKSLISKIQHTDNHVIISDVRFKNEADSLKQLDGLIFRIEGDPVGIRANSTRDLNHPSEIDMDDYENYDEIIYNNGTISDLRNKLQELINKYNIV